MLAALAALVAVFAVDCAQSRGTPQMRATLDDPLLDAELAGVGQGERTMQHEGQSFLGKPHYDEIILAFDVPDGAVESKALHRAVALARKHGWPLKQSEHSVRDDEFWSCTKELPGGHRAELSAYLVQGGPSGFFHNGVEEVDPTKVVFVIQRWTLPCGSG